MSLPLRARRRSATRAGLILLLCLAAPVAVQGMPGHRGLARLVVGGKQLSWLVPFVLAVGCTAAPEHGPQASSQPPALETPAGAKPAAGTIPGTQNHYSLQRYVAETGGPLAPLVPVQQRPKKRSEPPAQAARPAEALVVSPGFPRDYFLVGGVSRHLPPGEHCEWNPALGFEREFRKGSFLGVGVFRNSKCSAVGYLSVSELLAHVEAKRVDVEIGFSAALFSDWDYVPAALAGLVMFDFNDGTALQVRVAPTKEGAVVAANLLFELDRSGQQVGPLRLENVSPR